MATTKEKGIPLCVLLDEAFLLVEPSTKRTDAFQETNSASYLGTRGRRSISDLHRSSEQHHRRSFVTIGQAVGAVICGFSSLSFSLSLSLVENRNRRGLERFVDESTGRSRVNRCALIARKYRDDESGERSRKEPRYVGSRYICRSTGKTAKESSVGKKLEGVADG